MYDIFSYWTSSEDTCANQAWVKQVFDVVYQPRAGGAHRDDHVYVGFPRNELPHHLQAYFGRNRRRLLAVKRRVDPLAVLHFPSGIAQGAVRPL
jgi:hypothetical protein